MVGHLEMYEFVDDDLIAELRGLTKKVDIERSRPREEQLAHFRFISRT